MIDIHLLMDRIYEDNETLELFVHPGLIPVVPPKRKRKGSWKYNKELYKSHNEIEIYFLSIKRFRHIITRYDKLDLYI